MLSPHQQSRSAGATRARPDGVPAADQPAGALRDSPCRYCEEDVYLVFHPVAGSEQRVEATCYNPACPGPPPGSSSAPR